MANVVMSPKPKRVRAFMINGQLYEGGAEEYYTGKSTAPTPVATVGDELGATSGTDRLDESTEDDKKENKE